VADPPIETGRLASGHPFARAGAGSRVVLYIPGLSFTDDVPTPKATARAWKAWLGPIEQHGLSIVQVGRRADLTPGSSAADVADDYAAIIREQWGSAVAVMGISTGGGYAQFLASRHPDLVERVVFGFTAHRITDEVKERQRRAVDKFLAGRWRAGWAEFGPWFLPRFPRLGSAITWLAGPYIGGRYGDLRVLRIDADSDDAFDATDQLVAIRCPSLVVSGGRDAAYPPEVVREFVAGLPNVRHIEYPGAGHMGPGAAFARDACAFLAHDGQTEARPPTA
jgi:pimeloyl-ACP methyl ester carboxylesterase